MSPLGRRAATTSASLEGYHSPQVPAEVRLNTNESPLPAARRAGPRRSRPRSRGSTPTATPTATPPRCAAALAELHGVTPGRGVLRQRVQRGAAVPPARLRGPGPARSRPSSRPTRCTRFIAQLTGTPVVTRPARRAVRRRPRRGEGAAGRARGRRSRSCARPTTRPPTPTRSSWSSADRRRGAGTGRRRRGLRAVRPALGDRACGAMAGAEGLVVVRTFSKTWALAGGPPRLPARRPRGGRGVRGGRPALPPLRVHPGGRPRRACVPAEMEERVALVSEERGRVAGRPRRARRSKRGRRTPTSSSSGP